MALNIKFFEGLKKIKEIVSVAYLPVDTIPTEGSKRLVTSGAVISAVQSAEEQFFTNVPIEANTLRFSFSDTSYDPTAAGIGTIGTWKKCNTRFANIWDWTCSSANWKNAFFETFIDFPFEVILAGDTSSVTNMKNMFCDCGMLTSLADLDTSAVTDTDNMFYGCSELVKVPQMDTSSATAMHAMFMKCSKLEHIPDMNTSSATTMFNMFSGCYSLKEVPQIDTSGISNGQMMFNACESISTIPNIDTGNMTSMMGMFNGCHAIESIPDLDYGKVETLKNFIGVNNQENAPSKLETLPDMSTVTSALTNCDSAFKNVVNAKYGILEAYQALSAVNPANHADCFTGCGINTPEGRAALEQIPQSWGGLTEG